MAISISGLPNWSAKLEAVEAGTSNARVLLISDSIGCGVDAVNSSTDMISNEYLYSWPSQFCAQVTAEGRFKANHSSIIANKNSLAISANYAQGYAAYDNRMTFGAGWNTSSTFGDGGKNVGGYSFYSQGTTYTDANFHPANQCDTFEFFYPKLNIGSAGVDGWKIGFNGGTKGSLIPTYSATAALGKTIVTTTLGDNTMNLLRQTDNYTYFNGIVAYNSAIKEITFMNASWSGGRVVDFAYGNNVYSPLHMEQFTPDLVIIIAGGNDYFQNTAEATFKTALQTIITQCTSNGIDCLLCLQTPFAGGLTGAMYSTIYPWTIAVAADNPTVPLFDLRTAFVDGPTMDANGYFTPDKVHISIAGAAFYAKTIRDRILPPPIVSVTDFTQGRVVQRKSLTHGDITVTGNHDGSAVTVEARVMQSGAQIVGWTSLGTIGGSTYSGTIPNVPVGNGYNLEVRSKNSGGTVLMTVTGANTWGVGRLVLLAGADASSKFLTDATTETPSALARKYTSSWVAITGAAGIAFTNKMLTLEPGIPIGLIDGSAVLSSLDDWAYSNTHYDNSVSKVASQGGMCELIIISVGFISATYGQVGSQGEHEFEYNQLITNYRTDLTKPAYLSSIPIFIVGTQRSPLSDDSRNVYWARVRAAEYEVGDGTNIFMGAPTYDLNVDTDNANLAVSSMVTVANRLAKTYQSAILSVSGQTYKGPKISTARYYPASGLIEITYSLQGGSSLVGKTSLNNITGFRVSTDDFNTTLPVYSANIVSINKVHLYTTAGLTINPSVAYGTRYSDDVSNCLYNNAITF